MEPNLNEIEARALSLPPEERTRLAEDVFRSAAHHARWSLAMTHHARYIAVTCGLDAMDAIDVAAAFAARADECVPVERPEKSEFRRAEIRMVSLRG